MYYYPVGDYFELKFICFIIADILNNFKYIVFVVLLVLCLQSA